MYNIRRLLIYIHIILIYFSFIYSQSHHHHRRLIVQAITPPTRTSQTETPSTSSEIQTPPTINGDIDLDAMTERDHKFLLQKSKEVFKEDILGLKGREQPTTTNIKAYVPRAMLEEYIKLRDSVREVIPDDRAFYGKINIQDLDQSNEDFWSQVYDRYGSYDVEVSMGDDTPRFNVRGEAKHVAHIGLGDNPRDIPPNLEPSLPPHTRVSQNQKKFISVHLKFNLSQEVYKRPTAVDDLTDAVLHLARERIRDCEFQHCHPKPVSFFDHKHSTSPQQQHSDQSTSDEDDILTNQASLHNVPRYQRIYILQIFGYDRHNEPITGIHTSERIDTRQTYPLQFNIYEIVKYWLRNPHKNYGIIVRVTNDDPLYEQMVHLKNNARRKTTRLPRSSAGENVADSANASLTKTSENIDIAEEPVVFEHVRLKREFRSTSESEEAWIRDQPALLVYSNPTEPTKRHVKRHHEDQDNDSRAHEMQADEPDRSYSTSASTTTSGEDTQLPFNDSSLSRTDKPMVGSQAPSTSTIGSVSRREHTQASTSGSRRIQSSNRGSARSQSNSNQRSKKPGKQSARQAEKCSKRTLAINFDEVGWSSWIIAPHAYYANYCAGDCTWPLTDVQNATNHAIIQAIYHSVGRVVPKSCCAPVKLGRMAILYQLDGIVQMRQYDDMIVESCGCL